MQRIQVSIGLADLTNFGRAMDSNPVEDVTGLLQQAYVDAGDAIVAQGGRIWKYMGDALLFTCPTPKMAVKAARDIALAGPYRLGPDELRFFVAVATGEVLMARVGHPSLMIDDIFGSAINRAAMLLRPEAKESPDGVAMDAATRAAA